MLNAQRLQHLTRLCHDGIAIVRRDPRLHRNVEAAAVPWLDRDMQIRADIFARMPSLARARRFVFQGTRHKP